MTKLTWNLGHHAAQPTLSVRKLTECQSKHTVVEVLNPHGHCGSITVLKLDANGRVEGKHREELKELSRWTYSISMSESKFLVRVELDRGLEAFVDVATGQGRRIVIRTSAGIMM